MLAFVLLPLLLCLLLYGSFLLSFRLIDEKTKNPRRAKRWLTALVLITTSGRLVYQIWLSIQHRNRLVSSSSVTYSVSGPLPTYHPLPEYALDDFQEGFHGEVIVKATVGNSGTISNITQLSGPTTGMIEGSRRAVLQWHFPKPSWSSSPDDEEVKITIFFKLKR